MEPLTPGIYFGLDENRYFSDPALSRSDMMKLLEHPREYWALSWMNPKRKKREATQEMEFGKMLHCFLLEPALFEEKYVTWKYRGNTAGKTRISDSEFQKLNDIRDSLLMIPGIEQYFINGFQEVTIIHHCKETGLTFKTRHDQFLIPLSVDFKTTGSLQENFLKRQFTSHGYEVQSELYTEARSAAKVLIQEHGINVVGGRYPSEEWLHKFIEEPVNGLSFVLWKKMYPHAADVYYLDDMSLGRGRESIERAKKIYLEHFSEGRTEMPDHYCGGPKEFSTWHGVKYD